MIDSNIDHAECVFIAGANAAWAHPMLLRRIERAAPKSVVVVDPRRTEIARAASLHLQIAPGTDVALFNGMLHLMLLERWVDECWLEARTLKAARPAWVVRTCGIRAEDLYEAAKRFATSKATLSLYCRESMTGAAKNEALVDLHLATGQIGRRGAGLLPMSYLADDSDCVTRPRVRDRSARLRTLFSTLRRTAL